ncbi:hypothetical protein BTO01_29150 [Vibrio jasicida]|uniref:non-ribosomal peptide synthetase n=1 Tax=Vibrio jasicida TaxID=766224 RepID=UPI000CF56EED|nr:non-ribosomal peptide synthetase [Vibrio jasicida]PQJ44593.1 hypothetical protein BTO01_29150 [Vibrio jasicida]
MNQPLSIHDIPDVASIEQIFEHQADQNPNACALYWNGNKLSYQELNARAEQFAQKLRYCGLPVGSPIGISLPRSFDLIAGIIGILKAGYAFVPLDPSYPLMRLNDMLKAADISLVLTCRELENSLVGTCQTLLVDGQNIFTGEGSALVQKRPEDLAYIVFTSGSQGAPKGVKMPHRGLLNLIRAQGKSEGGFDLPLTTLQFTSVNFDVAFQEIFTTLSCGGILVMADEQVRTDYSALLALMAEQKVQRFFMPYALLRDVAEAAEWQQFCLPDLRVVITAGEQLKITSSIRNFFLRHPKARLVNHYGPSETHLATAWMLPKDPKEWPYLPPIGTAIDGVRLYVVDKQGQPVADGEPGELVIGGHQVALGYTEPHAESNAFREEPFHTDKGCRVYSSGDLVCRRCDGLFEYLGRIDSQIKVSGIRIEPAEVEEKIVVQPGVQDALVGAVDSEESHLLAAMVVMAEEHSIETLKAALQRTLPAAMVPSKWLRVNALPKTVNGKLDRKALSRVFTSEVVKTEPSNRHYDTVLAKLMTLWGNLLELTTFSPDADFFDLGGHSLLLMKLKSQLEQQFFVTISDSEFLDHSNARALSTLIESKRSDLNQLKKIWCSILDINDIGDHDDFFDLGGYSLLLMKMKLEIEKEFGIKVSDEELYKFSELSELILHIRKIQLIRS